MKLFNVYENEDFSVQLEYTDDYCAVHIPYVRELTVGVFRDIIVKIQELEEFVCDMDYPGLFAVVPVGNRLGTMLAKRTGFSLVDHQEGNDIYHLKENMQWAS